MSTYFISDLHLQESHTKLNQNFFAFLEKIKNDAKKLYILGDLFETWIGDDDESPFHNKVIDKIKSLSEKGIKVYLMHGNRDFHLGKRFAKACRAKLISDPSIIVIENERICLTHGDLLCSDDKTYLWFRCWSRFWFVRRWFLHLPLKKRRALADNARNKSREYQKDINETITDVNETTVKKWFKRYKVNTIIHGHTHRPSFQIYFERNERNDENCKKIKKDQEIKKRIVLSDWHKVEEAYYEGMSGRLFMVMGS